MLHKVKDTTTFDDIISTISNNNGTAKTSYGNRFADLDDITLTLLKDKKYILHDTAVSTGITSLELYNKLNVSSENEFYISDKYSILYYDSMKTSEVFFDADNKVVFGYKNNNLLSEQLNPFFKNSIRGFQKIKELKLIAGQDKIWLLNPKVLEKVENKKINYLEYDLFDSKITNKFTFVRSMNILNTIYFEELQIISAIGNIFNSLKEDGYFLIGRTGLDETNRATFYQKKGNTLDLVLKVNEGSEVEYLVNTFNERTIL